MPAQTDHYVGGTKHFECRVKGHPRPEIRWFKDGEEITKDKRYQFDHSHEGIISMVIENITHDDEGHYRCRAENSEGLASTSAYLLVRTHKEHPEEAHTSIHAMEIEEAVLYTANDKKGRKDKSEAKRKLSEPHFETPIEDVDESHSGERKVSAEEKDVVEKSFESVIESSSSTKIIASSSTSTYKTKSGKEDNEKESTKISVDTSEKSYHSSDDESGKLKTISEKSDTTSVQESLQDTDKEDSGSLLMRQTKRLFSQDFGEDSDFLRRDSTSTSTSERSATYSEKTSFSKKESFSSKSESVTSKTEVSSSKSQSFSSQSESVTGSKLETSGMSQSEVSSASSSVTETKASGKATSVVEEHGLEAKSSLSVQEDSEISSSKLITSSKSSEEDSKISTTSEVNASQKMVKESELSGQAEGKTESQERESDVAGLAAQNDSGSLEYSSSLESHKADSSVIITSEAEISASSESSRKITSEIEVEEASHRGREEKALEIKEESQKEDEKIKAEADVGESVKKTEEKVRKFSDVAQVEENLSLDENNKNAELERKAERETGSVQELEEESMTESETGSSVGSVVGVDVPPSPQKLEKQESKDEDDLKRDAKKKDVKKDDGKVDDDERNVRGREGVDTEKSGDGETDEQTEEVIEQTTSWVEKVEEDKPDVTKMEDSTAIGGDKEEEPEPAKPRIVKNMEDVKVEAGKTLKLRTQVEGTPKPEVKWAKDGRTVREGERITIITEDDVYSLEIQEVGEGDAGTYRLTAVNSSGEIFTEVAVNVTSSVSTSLAPGESELSMTATIGIPEFVMQPQDVSVGEFEPIKLTCSVKGDPAPKVTWEKDGTLLRSNRHVRVYESRGVYHVEIRESDGDDAGEYVCIAENSRGTSRATVNVVIEGVEHVISTIEEPEPAGDTSRPEEESTLGAVGGAVAGAAESSSDELFLKQYLVLMEYTDPETKVSFDGGEVVEVLDSRQKSGMWLVRGKVDKERVCFLPSSLLCISGDATVDETKNEEVESKEAKKKIDEEPKKEAEEETKRKSEEEAKMEVEEIKRVERESDEEEKSSQKKKERKLTHSPKFGSTEIDNDTSEDELRLRGIHPDYLAIADYCPPDSEIDSIRLTEGQMVEVIDKERCDSWLVRTRPSKTSPSRQGWVPSAYLEEKSVTAQHMRRSRSTRESFREDVLQVKNKQQEAGLKRRYVLKEMEETEREYVKELKMLVETYIEHIQLHPETVPETLKAHTETVFSNIADIFKFHDSQFLEELSSCCANPAAVGSTFLKWQSEFDNYVKFWSDTEDATFLLDSEEVNSFFQGLSKKMSGSKDDIFNLLKKPIDRLKMYQLLLKDVLRYSARAGEDCSTIEAAISMLIAIEKAVGNGKLLPLLEGFETDITKLGDLIRHDDFMVWEGDVSSSKAKDRHVFFFADKIVMTKKKKSESSSDQAGFSYKSYIDLKDVRLNESVTEDERRFELHFICDSAVEKVTLQARSIFSKQAWVKEIREALIGLGVSEPDRMPEKTAVTGEEDQTSPVSSAVTTPTTTVEKELVSETDSGTSPVVEEESGAESDKTKTDVDTYEDSDISSYYTATEGDEASLKPTFKHEFKKVVCKEGGSTRLECTVGEVSTSSVTWTKGNREIKEGEGIQITYKGETSTLEFSEAKASNSGTYTVTVSNNHGSFSASADLVVLEELTETDYSTDKTNGDFTETEVTETESEAVLEDQVDSTVLETSSVDAEVTVSQAISDSEQEVTAAFETEDTKATLQDTKEEEEVGEGKEAEEKARKEEEEEKKKLEEEAKKKEEEERKEAEEKARKEEEEEKAKLEEEAKKKEEEEKKEAEVKARKEEEAKKKEEEERKETEEKNKRAEEEKRKLEEEAKEKEEEERKEAEEKARKAEEEEKRKLEEEAKRQEEEERREAEEKNRKAEEEKRKLEEEEAKRKEEEERKEAEEKARKTEEEKTKAEEEVRQREEEEKEEQRKAEEEEAARKRKEDKLAEEELRRKEEDRKEAGEEKEEEEAKKVEEEKRKTEEAERLAEEEKLKEKEAKEEKERKKAEEESREREEEKRKVEEASKLEEEEKQREEEEAKKKEEEEKTGTEEENKTEKEEASSQEEEEKRRAEEEAKKAEEEETRKAEAKRQEEKAAEAELEAKRKEEEEQKLREQEQAQEEARKKEEEKKKKAEEETRRQEEEAVQLEAERKEKENRLREQEEESKREQEKKKTEEELIKTESDIKKQEEEQKQTEVETKDRAAESGELEVETVVTQKTETRVESSIEETTEKTFESREEAVSISKTQESEDRAFAKEEVDTRAVDSKTVEEKEEKEASKETKDYEPREEKQERKSNRKVEFKFEDEEEKKVEDRKPAAPQVVDSMDDCVIELGEVARFDCRVSAYPDPDITWFKDGNKVVPSAKHELINFHDDIFSLLIKKVEEDDSGRYTCLAKNEYGEAKSEALLNVMALKEKIKDAHVAPSFLTKFYNIEAVEGVPVEFVCVIDGNPEPIVTWILNGKEIESSSEILTRRQEDSVMLAFRSVQMEHSGEIICKLKNDSGEAICKARLKVKEDLSKRGDRPLFVEQPSDKEVCEGGEVTFECVISGLPDPEVTWYFNGRELHESRRRSMKRKAGQKYTLTIKEVIPENAGVYTCKAVNRAGDSSCAVELAVKELPSDQALKGRTFDRSLDYDPAKYAFPPSFTRRMTDQKSTPGRAARFEVMAIGVPEPEIEWQKDGFPLKWGPKYKIGREGHTAILVVENCDTIDEGIYTCNLFNDAGKTSCSAQLKVQDERTRQSLPRFMSPAFGLDGFRSSPTPARKSAVRTISPEDSIPSMPIDKPVLLEVKPNAAKLSWMPAPTAMLPDNAQRITYTVEARELPNKQWVRLEGNIEATTHFAYNLKPEKEYQFRVKAENRYGTSEATLPCTLLAREEPKRRELYRDSETPVRPVLPRTRPYVSDIGKETIQLGWKPAEVPYSSRAMSMPPVSYRVEAQKLPSEEWVPLASRVKKPSLYLSDLESNRDYNIRVRAQTPYGVSQPTEPIWIPRAKSFTGVPVSRPTIVEIEEGTARLQWNRVDIPAFDLSEEPLLYMVEMQEPPSYRWRELARRVPTNYYMVRDLDPAQDYRFRVRAESRDGLLSEPSPATSMFRTLALTHTPVDRLEVEEYDSDLHSARLSWRRVEVPPYGDKENPLLYMIEYETPQLEGWRPLVSGIPTTRYRVPDISPSDDYRFRVRALSPYGVSPPSYPTSLYSRASPMRPIAQDLHLSDLQPESLRLSWRSASVPPVKAGEPLSYQIEAMEYPKREWRPLATNIRDTNYRLSGLKPSSDYSFRVRAQTPSGLADPTAPVTLTSLPVRPRLPVREPIISELGSDSVRLQWKPAELPYYSRHTTPITYTVEFQELPGRDWVVSARGIPETSYTIRGLRGDCDYRFRVCPETEYGPGEHSLPVHAHRRTAPSLPSKEPLLSNIAPSSATLSWKPATLASGTPSRPIVYRVEGREPPSSTWYEIAGRVPSTSYNLQFLYPDQDYMFRVVADYDGVESEPTMSAYLPRRAGPPKMPKEAPYVSSVQPDSVILAWRSVELPSRITDYSPVTYRIEVQEYPRAEWRALVRQVPQTHFHVTNLRPDVDYAFRVRAENEFGISDPTEVVLVKKRAVPPAMSQHEPLISDVRSDSCRLTWQPAEMPSYLTDSVPVTYTVLMQEEGDHSWQPVARRVSGTGYYVTGLSPDKEYSFRVQAENNFGTSLPSFPSKLHRQLKGPIYSPEIEDVELSAFRLSWKQPSVAKKTTYCVETLEPKTWKWRPLVSRLPHPSYKVTDIQPSRDYAFRVRAEVGSVITEPSLPISFSRRRALPTVPVERPTLSEIYDDSVRVNWHPTLYHGASRRSAPQAFRLEVRELPDTYWRTLVPHTDAWSFEVTGLRPDQDYAFRVRSVTDSGMSEPSLPVFLYRQSATPRIPLPSPEISDVGENYIGLNWKLVDVPAFDMDETPLSFMVEAQRLPEYDWKPVARGVTGTSHKVTGLEPKYDYKFRLRGETSVGLTQPSAPVPVYRKPLVSGIPITNVTVDRDSNQPYAAKLRWNPVYIHPYTASKNTSYTIESQEPHSSDWRVVAKDVPTTSYTVPELSPKKDYLFRIKARPAGGDYSAPTPPVPFYRAPSSTWEKLPAPIIPVEEYSPINRPYIESLIVKVPPRMSIEKPDMQVVSPDCIQLSWKSARVPSATAHISPTSYRVEARHEDSFEWIEKATGVKGLSTEIRGLNPHIDYAFRVRAVNDFGWSESTLPTFLHRPQDLKDVAVEMEFEQYETMGSIFGDTSPPKMPIDTPRMGIVENRTMRLSWTPARIPAYARQTPITYLVEKKEPEDHNWVPVASTVEGTEHIIPNIKPDQDYLFRVRAQNEYGMSEGTLPAALTRSRAPRFIRNSASRERELDATRSTRSRSSSYSYIDSISTGVPPRVPQGRPSLSDISDTSASLNWQPGRMPSYIKGPVKINYIVEAREPPNHLWVKLDQNVPGTTYKLTSLRPDQDYMFRIRAFNDSGMSEPTLPVTLTREKVPEEEPRTLRRRSSVERFSSVERRASRERSMSMDRGSSVPRVLSRENSKREIEEDDMFAGKTPDTTPAAPEFVAGESPEVQHGIDARPVKITLQLRGLPLPTVDWYFNNKKIIYGDRFEGYVTPTGLVVLEFSPMTWADVGEYKCVAENELGQVEHIVKLRMSDPPTFLEPIKDLQLESQGDGRFSCRVDGIPYPSVKFMKDWRPLTETSRLKVSQDGDKWVLDVEQAIPADAGCYVCVAENEAGKVFCTARLSVDDDIPKTSVYYRTSNIEEDYYVLEELGRGRHSIVRRVIQRSTGKEFAAKFTQVREEADKDFFRQELDALLKQTGENVEKIHDAFETQRQLILVVEIAKDGNLLDKVVADDNWTEAKAAQVIKKVLQTLKGIHDSNVAHLDLKPTNLRFKSVDYTELRLIDFGFARKLPLTSDLTFNYGTPEFCSPEAIENEAVTPASDIWAVGVLAHLLLTGVSPFYAESIPEILTRTQTCNWSLNETLFSGLSPSCKDFISKILIREPASRLLTEACLKHDWLKEAEKSDSKKIDTNQLKAFQERINAEQKAWAVKSVANLRSLKRLAEGATFSPIQGLQPTTDPQTGEITLPDTEEYGEYLDDESWYDWQTRHTQGPDTELFPLKDAPYTVRVRGYKRAYGSIDEQSMVVDSDEELDPQDKEKMRTMKERRKMSEIDKEEIPPSLEKELEWMEEAKKRRQSRDPDEVSLSSKRPSAASISTEGLSGPVFKEKLHDMAFGVDDTVILRCVVAVPPTPTVVWYKNEELLSEGNRLKVNLQDDGEATLTIRNAKPYDAGVYKCVGRNKFGRVSNRMRLQLGDVPGRPGQPVVDQVSSTEALVIWEAPRSDGHSDILFYKVDHRARGKDRWTAGAYTTQEAAVISGLESDTKYRFRVSATNRFGTSHYSWASVEINTKPEGSLPLQSDDFFDLPKLCSLQVSEQPTLPSEFDDIIPDEEAVKQEPEPSIQNAEPDSVYNFGNVLYKGKFYEDKAITLPSDNDKPFVLRSVPSETGRKEIEILKSLRHERLVRLLTAFSSGDRVHLVLEHSEGEHIARHLSQRRKYSENTVAGIIRQVLFGLEYLQRSSIVHLNLQPASIVVSKLEGCEVKLTDFSLARKVSSPEGEKVPRQGYADFISPEVIVQDLAGFPADIWGVGTLTFLLLSGVSPFRGDSDQSTLVNIAFNRYDAIDLYENITTEALKFLYKVMKRLPRNRLSLHECLDHKWLQLTDKIMKEREDTVFLSNTLATFVQEYDATRKREDFRQNFDDDKLPIQMSKGMFQPSPQETEKME